MRTALARWVRRLAHAGHGADADADLREETETHRLLRQAQLERDGLTTPAAETRSRRDFGT
jgi:hypothetical protein